MNRQVVGQICVMPRAVHEGQRYSDGPPPRFMRGLRVPDPDVPSENIFARAKIFRLSKLANAKRVEKCHRRQIPSILRIVFAQLTEQHETTVDGDKVPAAQSVLE